MITGLLLLTGVLVLAGAAADMMRGLQLVSQARGLRRTPRARAAADVTGHGQLPSPTPTLTGFCPDDSPETRELLPTRGLRPVPEEKRVA